MSNHPKPNRGLTRYLHGRTISDPALFAAGVSGSILMRDLDLRKQFPQVTEESVVKSLWQLAREEVLNKAGNGFYKLPGDHPVRAIDTEKVVIDNLLDAMAKAQPVLHRCKRLLEALESVK
jgi:hypothetical protein